MIDPRQAADEAATKIIADLQRMDCLGYPMVKAGKTVEQLQHGFASIILTAITRAVPAPSQGLGR